MNKHIVVLIILIIVIAGGALVFLFYPKESSLSPEECRTIIKNSGNKKIDVVFLTDNVEENIINKTIDFFLNSMPFSENKEKFNFFYAGKSNCKVVNNEFVFCYSRDAIKKSSVCPNDYVIVLTNQSQRIRSSAYINFISLNIFSTDSIVLHEFGHVFANLADEYAPSIIPFGSKNCRKNCSYFNNIEGCYNECSEADYYRSSENSLMRSSMTPEYRKLNTLLIENNLNKYE
jgi:hypothetical protein